MRVTYYWPLVNVKWIVLCIISVLVFINLDVILSDLNGILLPVRRRKTKSKSSAISGGKTKKGMGVKRPKRRGRKTKFRRKLVSSWQMWNHSIFTVFVLYFLVFESKSFINDFLIKSIALLYLFYARTRESLQFYIWQESVKIKTVLSLQVKKKETNSRGRIARSLGIKKPKAGSIIPSVYRPSEYSLGSMRAEIGAAYLSVYGDPFDLDPIDDR